MIDHLLLDCYLKEIIYIYFILCAFGIFLLQQLSLDPHCQWAHWVGIYFQGNVKWRVGRVRLSQNLWQVLKSQKPSQTWVSRYGIMIKRGSRVRKLVHTGQKWEQDREVSEHCLSVTTAWNWHLDVWNWDMERSLWVKPSHQALYHLTLIDQPQLMEPKMSNWF